MNLDWVENNTIFECLSGSHAYGLNTPESDQDFRGVCVSPREYYMGLSRFDQVDTKDPDRVVFDLKKFVCLAAENNPNILELLFVDTTIRTTPSWEVLLSARDAFLSEKCRYTYAGYAFSQIKRMETHRRWLLNPPHHSPSREEFGLPSEGKMPPETMGAIESVIRSQAVEVCERHPVLVDYVEPVFEAVAESVSILAGIAFDGNVLDLFARERKYRAAKREWEQYQTWLRTRNPKRAALEARCGYDAKHLSHVFRLMIQGEEILTKGTLTVRLHGADRDKCLAIKQGLLPGEEIIEEAKARINNMKSLPCVIPKTPDRNRINRVMLETIDRFYR